MAANVAGASAFSNYEIRCITIRFSALASATDFRERIRITAAENMSRTVKIPAVRVAIKYKLRVTGKNRTNGKAEGAIDWKYDSPLSGIPTKFMIIVIDIGTADSLLRVLLLDER